MCFQQWDKVQLGQSQHDVLSTARERVIKRGQGSSAECV